eukprot:CAMPEP_0170089968 /NCGR_PEP_ID=MMETSP0019_2-20121128/23907_1 /TAXON_ID=98059 /ORGANISM="Dinobryon sp., Strain UTEXLB2267" /LENGTH=87 /DNA_ID=CAMNT_0010309071 /DNA_START=340 /DNA_END=603 /DNA_ORIENTATION=-
MQATIQEPPDRPAVLAALVEVRVVVLVGLATIDLEVQRRHRLRVIQWTELVIMAMSAVVVVLVSCRKAAGVPELGEVGTGRHGVGVL